MNVPNSDRDPCPHICVRRNLAVLSSSDSLMDGCGDC